VGDGHDHALDLSVERGRQRRTLWIVLVANAAFMAVEVVGGIAFGSLALLADAAHMLSDVVGLGIALIAHAFLARPATDRHTYGLQRAEVLGAQANGVILVAASIWIVVEAVGRLDGSAEIDGGGLLVVAGIGLIVNLVSAFALMKVRGRSLNMQGAFVHMLADAAGSVGAIAAGVAVIVADATWVDAAVSIAIAGLVLWAAFALLRDATRILLEGVPKHLDPAEVSEGIVAQRGVESLHHLHLWSLASDTPALSAHVILEGDLDLHAAQLKGDEIREYLHERFEIDHVTLELECHGCDVPMPVGPSSANPRSEADR
jgi:cobalt-zinc-cadmium efflux system protein